MKSFEHHRYYRLTKEGSWIVLGQITSVFGMLVLVRMLTEYLDPIQYGQLALGLTVAGLVNQVVMGGITNGIVRFYSIASEKHDLQGYLRDSWRLLGFATLAVGAIGLLLMFVLFSLGYSRWVGLVVAVLFFSVVSAFNSSLSGIQNAARQRAIMAIHGGFDVWLKILLAIGVMLWLGKSSTAVVIGYTVSSMLITVSQFFFLRHTINSHHVPCTSNQSWMSQIWAYSWPFSIFGIFTGMHLISDRWALEAFTSTAEVGKYALLFQLGYAPISMVMGMVMTFLGPILFQLSGDATDQARISNVHRLIWQISRVGIMVIIIGFVVTFTLHERIFHLLVAAQYQDTSYLLPWVLLAGGFFAMGQILSLKLMSEMKLAKLTTAKIITALLGLGLNFYGAFSAGLLGVVIALVVFSIIYLVWIIYLASNISFSSVISKTE